MERKRVDIKRIAYSLARQLLYDKLWPERQYFRGKDGCWYFIGKLFGGKRYITVSHTMVWSGSLWRWELRLTELCGHKVQAQFILEDLYIDKMFLGKPLSVFQI